MTLGIIKESLCSVWYNLGFLGCRWPLPLVPDGQWPRPFSGGSQATWFFLCPDSFSTFSGVGSAQSPRAAVWIFQPPLCHKSRWVCLLQQPSHRVQNSILAGSPALTPLLLLLRNHWTQGPLCCPISISVGVFTCGPFASPASQSLRFSPWTHHVSSLLPFPPCLDLARRQVDWSYHFLFLQSTCQMPYVKVKVKVAQSCPNLCDPMDYIQSMEFSGSEYWSG